MMAHVTCNVYLSNLWDKFLGVRQISNFIRVLSACRRSFSGGAKDDM